MADVELVSLAKDILLKGNPLVFEGVITGTDMKHGHIVTYDGETYPEIDLCADGENPAGVLWKHTNELDVPDNFNGGAADVAFATGAYVKIIRLDSPDCDVLARMSPKATNANDISGLEALGASAESGGDGELDVITALSNVHVGQALRDQAVTVGSTDTMAVRLKLRGGNLS